MPVIPAFSAFAPKPDLAGSFLGGARLAQDAQQHAQALQFQREKLAQDAQMAEMELAAKSASAERQQLRQQQEMELDKAYKDAQIGLKQRDLDESEKVLQFKVSQAAQQSAVQMTAARRIAAGEDATKVWQELGPQAGIRLPAGLFNRERAGVDFSAGASAVPGLPEDYKQVQTGPGTRRIIHAPATATESGPPSAQPVPGLPGKMYLPKASGKVISAPDESAKIQNKIDALIQQEAGDFSAMSAAQNEANKRKLDAGEKLNLQRYKDRRDRIEELRKSLQGNSTSTGTNSAPFKEGQRVRNKKNGKLYVIRNGEPVEVKE